MQLAPGLKLLGEVSCSFQPLRYTPEAEAGEVGSHDKSSYLCATECCILHHVDNKTLTLCAVKNHSLPIRPCHTDPNLESNPTVTPQLCYPASSTQTRLETEEFARREDDGSDLSWRATARSSRKWCKGVQYSNSGTHQIRCIICGQSTCNKVISSFSSSFEARCSFVLAPIAGKPTAWRRPDET